MLQADEELAEISRRRRRREWEAKQRQLKEEREREQREVAALPAAQPVTAAVAAALPVEYRPAVLAAGAATTTPARLPLPPRQLTFSAASIKPPLSAEAIAYKASTDALPDLYPGQPAPVRVTVTSSVAGDGGVATSASSGASIVNNNTAAVPVSGPLAPPGPFVKPVQPVKFTGDKHAQNERVAAWLDEVNIWLVLSRIDPAHHLHYARGLFDSSGSVGPWLRQQEDDLYGLIPSKAMTWEWLQQRLIQYYAQPSGLELLRHEWKSLRMGDKNADGSESGNKATMTVADYTSRFLYYMRQLHPLETQGTNDILVIDRYLEGIERGYGALWRTMLGVQRVLRFGSLREAILAAQLAEADMAIAKNYSSRHYHSSSSSSSSAPSYGGGGGGRGYRYQRYGSCPAADSGSTLNYTRAEGSTLGESDRPSSPQQAQLYGFRYSRDSSNGRYVLSEAEAHQLYDEKRCFKCYKQHPFGPPHARCTIVQKQAPLRSSK